MVHKSGQSPGQGKYICIHCGEIYQLKNFDTLTACAKCNNLVFEKEFYPLIHV